MQTYRQLVEEVVRAVKITSPTSFTWFGSPSSKLPARIRRAIEPDVARSHLLFTVRNHLYTNVYQVGQASPTPPEIGPAAAACQEAQLTGQLALANGGRGYWEPGWVVRTREDGQVAVRRRGIEVWVSPDDCLASPGTPLAPGLEVALRRAKESSGLSPGYYIAMSEEPLIWDGATTLVRLYWHLTPDYAPRLVELITDGLNRAHTPFRLKVLSNAASYRRRDAAVLYLHKADLLARADLLAEIQARCQPGMRPGTPAFTKALGASVGLAEDPGRGESFGQHRCETLAAGLIGATERGATRVDARVRAVLEAFADAGIDVDRPYLNAGSADDYELDAFAPRSAPSGNGRLRSDRPRHHTFLSAATEIARRLARQAVWHQDRCTWLGLLPHASGAGQVGLSYGALGYDLYDGTAGIALFLAEAACLTGDDELGRAALGAIRQALHAAEARGPALSIGLYTGALGVAFAAACVGLALSESAVVEGARRLLGQVEHAPTHPAGFDILDGRAGAITALLGLYEAFGECGDRALAERLGHDLLASATRTADGWSWHAPDRLDHHDLTGLSHGAAGAGHALLELFDLTGEAEYREGAEAAFRYERSWFSPETGNWPDLREEPARRRPGQGASTFRTQWCHGAPGIALTRIRAWEILGDPRYLDEARLALATTASGSAEALRTESLSYSLCHGLAGNADVLLEGRELAGRAGAAGGSLPEEIAGTGIVMYAEGQRPWPCGIPVPGCETPGLMLGLAGIGHFYLRLHHPTLVPSVLLVRRQQLVARLRALAGLRRPSMGGAVQRAEVVGTPRTTPSPG